MHKSRLAAFVLDSKVDNIQQAGAFWSRALGYQLLPSVPDWAERYAYLDNPSSEPKLLLQKVDHPSHIHLDIETDNIQAEVERLSKLGALVVKQMPRWTVMESPTGHRFCVVMPQRADFAQSPDVKLWP
ncbi:MAG: VOC family protein [Pararheinheimera sp.]|nr:VOC family protein [Rheinheimera sp.]